MKIAQQLCLPLLAVFTFLCNCHSKIFLDADARSSPSTGRESRNRDMKKILLYNTSKNTVIIYGSDFEGIHFINFAKKT